MRTIANRPRRRSGKSLQYYREAESDWKKDGNTSNAVYVSGCIASVYYAQGDYNKALPLFENWYQYQCRENGVSSPKTIVARNKLAMCYMKVGQISKAEEMLRASITIGKEAGWSAYCNRCLGNFYRAQKEWIKASTARAMVVSRLVLSSIKDFMLATCGQVSPYAVRYHCDAVL